MQARTGRGVRHGTGAARAARCPARPSVPTLGACQRPSPPEGAAGPAVEIDGLVMRYGDKVAVDGLGLTVERASITAVLGPNGAGKTTTLETAEGYRSPQRGPGPGAGARPGPRPARPAPPDRRDAPARWCLERRPRRRDAAPHRPAARPPARRRRSLRPARPRRLRPYAVPPALGRPAAAARPGDGDRGPPRDRVRGRADRRHGPRRTAYDLGGAPGPPHRRRHGRPHHALHGGGRAPRRPDPHHRPRPPDRQRYAARAHPRRRLGHDPAGGDQAVPRRRTRVAARARSAPGSR